MEKNIKQIEKFGGNQDSLLRMTDVGSRMPSVTSMRIANTAEINPNIPGKIEKIL